MYSSHSIFIVWKCHGDSSTVDNIDVWNIYFLCLFFSYSGVFIGRFLFNSFWIRWKINMVIFWSFYDEMTFWKRFFSVSLGSSQFCETWGTDQRHRKIWWSECFLGSPVLWLESCLYTKENNTDCCQTLGVWNFPGNQSPKYRCIWSQACSQTILGLWVRYRSTCNQNLL